MPRDLTGCGRYPPQPAHKPIAFYSAVRLGDKAALGSIMADDPYFVTQDNGAGGPAHFATTYKQLDMLAHLVEDLGAEVNQADDRGLTPLHRAAYLAHYDG
jgi:[acyl-carrier-protein] S-malonyltransferase